MATTKAGRIVSAIGGPVTITLLALNVAVFLCLHLCVWCGVDDNAAAVTLALPSDAASLASHPWTLLTYMFSQWDGLHLLVNMLWLLSFGPMFYRIGLPELIWRVYLAGGIGGAIAFVITAACTPVPGMLAGASAAVMGIVVATAVYRPHARLSLFGCCRHYRRRTLHYCITGHSRHMRRALWRRTRWRLICLYRKAYTTV